MNNGTQNLAKILFVILFLCISSNLYAVEKSRGNYGNSHFIGGRFGAWTMTTNEDFIDSLADFSSGSLYAEFFYSHQLAPYIAAEFSIGIFSQGDLQYDAQSGTTIGAAKLYPFFVSAKLFPLSKYKGVSLRPYARIGGGIVHGTRDISSPFYNDPANYYVEENQTKITYTWGFGIDWLIADQIGLNIDFKNTPIKFGEALAGIKDYSGWSLTVGVGYRMRSK